MSEGRWAASERRYHPKKFCVSMAASFFSLSPPFSASPSLSFKHHLQQMASSSSERGWPLIQRNSMGTETETFPLNANINPQGTPPQNIQPTSTTLNVAPEFKKLSDWGKNAYRDISEKMINAGIRSDKFDDGMLKKTTSLGQWLIKELVRPPFLPLSSSLLHFPSQTSDL